MTLLQILNSIFYLLIYPFLIGTLGANSYGSYVYAFSISVFFVSFVQFGFDTPALKIISQIYTALLFINTRLLRRFFHNAVGSSRVSL